MILVYLHILTYSERLTVSGWSDLCSPAHSNITIVFQMNVEGSTCSNCKSGFFHLSSANRDGCLSCFCMGVTQQCSSSTYYRDLVWAGYTHISRTNTSSICTRPLQRLPITSMEVEIVSGGVCLIRAARCLVLQVSSAFAPGNFQGFALVNRQRTNRITTGFTVEVSTDGTQLSDSNLDYLGQGPHYWQLPRAYQGDKVSSTVLLRAFLRLVCLRLAETGSWEPQGSVPETLNHHFPPFLCRPLLQPLLPLLFSGAKLFLFALTSLAFLSSQAAVSHSQGVELSETG